MWLERLVADVARVMVCGCGPVAHAVVCVQLEPSLGLGCLRRQDAAHGVHTHTDRYGESPFKATKYLQSGEDLAFLCASWGRLLVCDVCGVRAGSVYATSDWFGRVRLWRHPVCGPEPAFVEAR